jgi:hypothetical protein
MNQVPESSEHTSEYCATGGTEKRVHRAPANDAPRGSHQSLRKKTPLVVYHGVTIWRRIELAPSERFRLRRFFTYARCVPPDFGVTIDCGAGLFRVLHALARVLVLAECPNERADCTIRASATKSPSDMLLCRRALAVRREAETHTAAWLFCGRRQVGATN